jgi:hypothetical protein
MNMAPGNLEDEELKERAMAATAGWTIAPTNRTFCSSGQTVRILIRRCCTTGPKMQWRWPGVRGSGNHNRLMSEMKAHAQMNPEAGEESGLKR